MDKLNQDKTDKMWENIKVSSRKAQPKIRRRKMASGLFSWLKEHGVELLALVVAVIALIRTF